MYPFGITVTVVRGGGKDRWGDVHPATEHAVEGCVAWPASNRPTSSTSETLDYSDVVTVGYTLALPDDADVLPTDQIRMPDDPTLWAVEGYALPYRSPFTGWAPGKLVALRKTTG